MEPELILFLKRITKTIFIGVLWMVLNVRFGIMYNYGFIIDKISLANILFYLWFSISTIIMLILFYKIWKTSLNLND